MGPLGRLPGVPTAIRRLSSQAAVTGSRSFVLLKSSHSHNPPARTYGILGDLVRTFCGHDLYSFPHFPLRSWQTRCPRALSELPELRMGAMDLDLVQGLAMRRKFGIACRDGYDVNSLGLQQGGRKGRPNEDVDRFRSPQCAPTVSPPNNVEPHLAPTLHYPLDPAAYSILHLGWLKACNQERLTV